MNLNEPQWRSEVGKQTFLKIANPQLLRLIPLLLIHKFIRCVNPQILKFSWLIRKSQKIEYVANPQSATFAEGPQI